MQTNYDIIKSVRITEKTTFLREKFGKVTLTASTHATKKQIAKALNTFFDKIVIKSIRSITVIPKLKKFKGRPGQTKGYKKFIVTLAEGSNLDFIKGVQ